MHVVTLSDTHQFHPRDVPDGDVLIHAGDLCCCGSLDEFNDSLNWLSRFPHRVKVYVPGNHDYVAFMRPRISNASARDLGIELLADRYLEIDSIGIYGYPWTPEFGWTRAFMLRPDKLVEKAVSIQHCDILISHGPAATILDSVRGIPVGCPSLLKRVQKLQPSVHLFGHIHTMHGGRRRIGNTLHANVAYCADNPQRPAGDPIFEFDITRAPDGTVNVSYC